MTAIQEWLATVRDVPRIECEVLLAEVLALSRAQILTHPERQLTPDEHANLQASIASMRQGKPLAYILGHREFWGLSFKVTPAVLIPRPETELLVELTLDLAPEGGRILELGTGSGVIAIALASERTDFDITATDKDRDALAIAVENSLTHKVSIEFLTSNWLTEVSGSWDIIVSNPPYIADQDPHLPSLQAEPQHALVAGHEGLDDIHRIVADSRRHLSAGGQLILEHGHDQASRVRDIMADAGYEHIRSAQDLAQIERATIGRMDIYS
jgi:release factor glutamine methyltransferase